MRITVLGAAFDNDNLGVGALAVGTVASIVEAFPDAQISLLDYALEPHVFQFHFKRRTIPIHIVNLRMKPYVTNNILFLTLVATALRLMPVRRFKRWLISHNAVLHHIQASDLIVSLAGGDSFSDLYGMRRLIDVSLPQILVLLLGKDLVLLPQTIGPFNGRIARIIARVIIRRAKLVYSRDQESLRESMTIIGGDGKQEKMRFCYDVGLIVPPEPPANLDVVGISLDAEESCPLVGLNVSGLLFIGGYKRDDAFGFKDKYIEFIYKIINLIINGKGARILLLPHTLGNSSESDSDVCAQLYEELRSKYSRRIGLVRGRYTTVEMKHVIGRSEFFVGSRMHACIGALSQGIPAIAVAYSRKFIGVLDTLGVAKLVVDPRIMSIDEMLKIIGDSYDKRREIKTLLEGRMTMAREAVLSLVSEIWQGGHQPSLHTVQRALDKDVQT
jgi:colanic acid/amylovoran biosynthesis protein